MTREIKFRCWGKEENKMIASSHDEDDYLKDNALQISLEGTLTRLDTSSLEDLSEDYILMQFTGLLDKNGLHELYEGDILDTEGHLIGNIYEHKNVYQEKTNLIIQGFGDKNWGATYKEAMERGCTDPQRHDS